MTGQATTTREVQEWLDTSPFITFLGIKCTRCEPDEGHVTFLMPLRPELQRDSEPNRFHGGPIASLVDIAADLAIMAFVRYPIPTINFRVDYLRPSLGPTLTATTWVRRIGRTLAIADVDVTDTDGNLTAIGRGTFATTNSASVSNETAKRS